jgi:uncharacterized protein (TIGR02996 family)
VIVNHSLMRAIICQPAEDTPRLEYADWLDENATCQYETDRAEFIRLQVDMAVRPRCDTCGNAGVVAATLDTHGMRGREPVSLNFGTEVCHACSRFGDTARLLELLSATNPCERRTWMADSGTRPFVAANRDIWKAEPYECGFPICSIGASSLDWRRGFIAHVNAPVAVFMMRAGQLADSTPLESVSLTGVVPILRNDPEGDYHARPWRSHNGAVRVAPYLGFAWTQYEVTREGEYVVPFIPLDKDVIPEDLWDLVEKYRDKPHAQYPWDSLRWLSWACVAYACEKSRDAGRSHWIPRPPHALYHPPSLTRPQYDLWRSQSGGLRPAGMARVKTDYAYESSVRAHSAHDSPASNVGPGWG